METPLDRQAPEPDARDWPCRALAWSASKVALGLPWVLETQEPRPHDRRRDGAAVLRQEENLQVASGAILAADLQKKRTPQLAVEQAVPG